MKSKFFILALCTTILTFPFVSSAHWIAGYVQNALDGTSPNDRIVRLWNPSNSEETLGTIGPSGLSGTSNVYMIDCEMLSTPCQVGDKLNLTIQNDASGYTAKNIVEVTITGHGFDMAPNLTINTPPQFSSILLEDIMSSPANELDLTPASTTQMTCTAIISDPEGQDSIQKIQAALFHTSSTFNSLDDNNLHYTNQTCELNTSYGTNTESQIICTFEVEYYAAPGTWNCQINATDNYSSSSQTLDTSTLNTLLAIGVKSPMGFGDMEFEEVSQEQVATVTNYGNTAMNLTLSGYGQTELDGNAMECGSQDIPIDLMKFNLSTSTSGNLTLSQFETTYQNLTSSPTTYEFNLNAREDDITNEANKETYWRVYVPEGTGGNCNGNIVFAATQS